MKQQRWHSTRAKLKKKFLAMGVTACQMCGRTDYLSFAHRLKRRFITTQEELEVVALLCMDNPNGKGCHNKLEHGPKEVMYEVITKLYEQREGIAVSE
jgi:4-hydroxy-3-methylbut-2-en-1-yl diphosphate synthase IspG/GcpE